MIAMKRFTAVLLVLSALSCFCAGAQDEALSAEADSTLTIDVEPVRKRPINDYSMIGVNYGVSFTNTYFSPSKHNRTFSFAPNYISVTYTKFSKMFDTLPYFALVLGAAMGDEGYAFIADPETGISADVDGATQCRMKVFEVPAMMQLHLDFDPGKIMLNAGVYGGWRSTVKRSGPSLDPEWTDKFRSYERQLDYGFQGGAGFALIFDPVEIHFNCLLRWSWSNLYAPDYSSAYYYNYAYPMDIIATVGLHFHLSRRNGKTRKELKREAYEIVYGKTQDNSGQSR